VPISGLVIVFDSSEAMSDLAVEQLASHPSIVVGERDGDRVAIVVDSASKDHDVEIWEWIASLPGVSDIKIAFVGFDDADNLPNTNARLN
jgi:nitrate reductase NapAB chaperone NapD